MEISIGSYPFQIKLVPPEEIENCDGRTYHNERVIKIRNDLDEITTELVLRHEVVHALLGTQGRVYQRKFDLEEVCEFIAYKLPEIKEVCDRFMYAFLDNKRREKLNEIH